MRRIIGACCVGLAFLLPFVIVPQLNPEAMAMSYGFGQGPAWALGVPLIALMVQGLRMFNGDD